MILRTSIVIVFCLLMFLLMRYRKFAYILFKTSFVVFMLDVFATFSVFIFYFIIGDSPPYFIFQIALGVFVGSSISALILLIFVDWEDFKKFEVGVGKTLKKWIKRK